MRVRIHGGGVAAAGRTGSATVHDGPLRWAGRAQGHKGRHRLTGWYLPKRLKLDELGPACELDKVGSVVLLKDGARVTGVGGKKRLERENDTHIGGRLCDERRRRMQPCFRSPA